jgi:N-acylneuraminate cytidylyltransferase
MIGHSIIAAQNSGLFDRIIVSTDDEEIAEVAARFGAEVPFVRPPHLSDDYTGTIEVVAHAVDWFRQQGESPGQVCCIYATAPFVDHEDIRRAGSLLDSGGWSYVFAATTYAYPVFRSFSQAADGSLSMLFPEHYTSRSQDLPEMLHDAGQFYWGRAEAWLDHVHIFGDRSAVVAIPRWRVQDIDTAEDWTQAEAMAKYLLPQAGEPVAVVTEVGALHATTSPMDTPND